MTQHRETSRRAPEARRRPSSRTFRPSMVGLEARSLMAAGPLGINATPEYIDVMKTTRDWQQLPGGAPLSRDASGWPTSDAEIVLFDQRVNQPWNGPDPGAVAPDLGGTYHLSFQGQAYVGPPGWNQNLSIQNYAYDPSTNVSRADVVVTHNSSDLVILDFRNTVNTTSATGAGVANVRLTMPGYAANTTQVFTDRFLNAVKPFGSIRALSSDGANDYQAPYNGLYTAEWSQRRLPTDSSQADSYNGKIGQSWEYIVAEANAANADLWINVPGPATDDYIRQLAALIKNGDTVGGVAYAGLKPGLKLYVENSNEVWGGIYNPYAYNLAAAKAEVAAGGSNLNNDGSTDGWVWAQHRYLARSAQIVTDFNAVYGADPSHAVVRPVLGWQEGGYEYFVQNFPWFQQNYGAPSTYFYGLGNANYWSPTDYSTVDSTINSLAAGESATVTTTARFTAVAATYGLKNVAYEGGPAIGGPAGTQAGLNALAASRDPRMEALVRQHYLNWYANGGDLAQFLGGPFVGWTPTEQWGAAELAQADNPLASAKYRGLADLALLSPPAQVAGVRLSSSATTAIDMTHDYLGDWYNRPGSGNSATFLVRADAAGSYNLSLSLNASSAPAVGSFQVFVNGKQVGGDFAATAASTVSVGPVALSAGYTGIRILTVHGTADPAYPADYFHYAFYPNTLNLAPVVAAPPPSPVAFLGTDTTTQGNWKGVYGADGADVIGDSMATPAYAALTPVGQSSWTWDGAPTATQAPQRAGTGRVAATWYADSSYTMDLNLTDGAAHKVSLYALDYDRIGRSERIDILDPATGALLDSQNVSSFVGGQYLSWKLKGHVQIRVTNTGSRNAVLSGVYFDPAS